MYFNHSLSLSLALSLFLSLCMSSVILQVFTNAKRVARYSNTVYNFGSLTLILTTRSIQCIMILERNNCRQLVRCVMLARGDDPITKSVFILLCFMVLG
jgi:hypothetical protein